MLQDLGLGYVALQHGREVVYTELNGFQSPASLPSPIIVLGQVVKGPSPGGAVSGICII